MIDIHHFSRKLDTLKNLIKKSSKITERNKLLSTMKRLSEMIKKDWDLITKDDVRELLDRIDTDPNKGEWSQHDYRVVLRKFVAWLRNEYGYPESYPQREELSRLLPILKYPSEVMKIKVKKPEKLKAGEDIPTSEEMQYLSDASINPRDKAFFEMAREVGIRIGGIGSRQIKHVSFDELGARVTMYDKTMRGEPVRFISSSSYLRIWLDSHPFRNELEGVPRAIMCKQRGWKPDSKQPERYARIVTKDVDSYYAKRFGLNGKEVKEPPKPGRCPRCREVNAPGAGYCYKCGLPLSQKAENVEQQVQAMIETLLIDPEIHRMLREKLLANGGMEVKTTK